MYNNTNNIQKSIQYEIFIYFLISIKTIFILTTVVIKFYEYKYKGSNKKEHQVLIEDLKQFRDRIEFVFKICMSCILIWIFYPWHTKPLLVDNDTKMLLYLYGFFSIITSPWNIFFNDNQWFDDLMKFIGTKREMEKNNNPYSHYNYEKNAISRYYNDAVYTGNIITQTPPEPQIPVKKTHDKVNKVL